MRTRNSSAKWLWCAAAAAAWGVVAAPGHAQGGPQAVLPPGTAVKGWKQVGASRLYNSSNLFDLIDGEAQAVLAYGFSGCAHGEYAPARQSRPALTVDVYAMSTPLDAFGLFSSDRISGQPVAIGTEGVQISGSGLNFWKGRFVVRTALIGQGAVTPANRAAQMAFARAAAARVQGASSPPALVKALPPGRQPRSEKYERSDVAGQAFIKNAITARYPALGQGAELFIAQYPSPAGAKAGLEAYRAQERSGTGLKPVAGLGSAAFAVVDRYAKNVVAAQKGRYLVGVLRARDQNGAVGLVRQALARLP